MSPVINQALVVLAKNSSKARCMLSSPEIDRRRPSEMHHHKIAAMKRSDSAVFDKKAEAP
jgi:hypothetical protein